MFYWPCCRLSSRTSDLLFYLVFPKPQQLKVIRYTKMISAFAFNTVSNHLNAANTTTNQTPACPAFTAPFNTESSSNANFNQPTTFAFSSTPQQTTQNEPQSLQRSTSPASLKRGHCPIGVLNNLAPDRYFAFLLSDYNRRSRKRSTENENAFTFRQEANLLQETSVHRDEDHQMQGMPRMRWQGRQSEQFLQKRSLEEKECLLHADEVAHSALAATNQAAAPVGTGLAPQCLLQATGPYPPYYLPYPGGGALGLPTKSIKTTITSNNSSIINSKQCLTQTSPLTEVFQIEIRIQIRLAIPLEAYQIHGPHNVQITSGSNNSPCSNNS